MTGSAHHRRVVLDLLRGAVIAGNYLLRRIGGLFRGRSPVRVWVVEYAHKHGTDFSAHATAAEARQVVAWIARQFWADIAAIRDELPATPEGLSDEEMVQMYFDACAPQESYEVHGLDVEPLSTAAPPETQTEGVPWDGLDDLAP